MKGDGSDEMGINKQQTTLWIYLYRCSKLGPRSLWIKQSDCYLEEMTRAVCDKAIRHRMTKADIDHSPIKSPKLYKTPSTQTMDCVKDMIDLLVSSNPELYSEITFKLNIPIQDERTVCKTYSEFAENLFQKGVSWPLIISLLAFSGSLAAECTRNGRSILVRRICDWATLFIVMRLKDWIQHNGGWDGLHTFVNEKSNATKGTFKTDRLQFDLLHKHLSTMKLDKSIRIILMVVIFVFLLLLSYFKSFECQHKNGKRSKFSIYKDC